MSNPEVSFNGTKFEVKNLFAEGRPVNAKDAEVLNRAAINQVRLDVNPLLKDEFGSIRDENIDEIVIPEDRKTFYQTLIFSKFDDFAWAESAHRGRSADPVMARVKIIARGIVNRVIQKKGKAASDFAAKQLTEMVNKVIEQKGSELKARAEEQLADEEQEMDLDI